MNEPHIYLARFWGGQGYLLSRHIPCIRGEDYTIEYGDIFVEHIFDGFADLQPGEVVKLEFSEVEGRVGRD